MACGRVCSGAALKVEPQIGPRAAEVRLEMDEVLAEPRPGGAGGSATGRGKKQLPTAAGSGPSSGSRCEPGEGVQSPGAALGQAERWDGGRRGAGGSREPPQSSAAAQRARLERGRGAPKSAARRKRGPGLPPLCSPRPSGRSSAVVRSL